jgi:hypothetical protein
VHVVCDLGDLHETVARAAQDACGLAADQENAPTACERKIGERLEKGRVVDGDAGVDGTGQLDHLEHVGRAGAEDRQAVGAFGGKVGTLEVRTHSVHVLAEVNLLVVTERVAVPQPAVRLVEQ